MIVNTVCPISICETMKRQERISSDVQTIGYCSLEVTQDTFNRRPMILSGGMHKLAYLVDCITDIRSSEGKIL
jgi:hypothetical protein